LQYHIWLACSATRLLVIVPGMPKVNLLATSAIFILAANQLFEKTASLKVHLCVFAARTQLYLKGGGLREDRLP
jgi:flagellar biosynthesis component FlhA